MAKKEVIEEKESIDLFEFKIPKKIKIMSENGYLSWKGKIQKLSEGIITEDEALIKYALEKGLQKEGWTIEEVRE